MKPKNSTSRAVIYDVLPDSKRDEYSDWDIYASIWSEDFSEDFLSLSDIDRSKIAEAKDEAYRISRLTSEKFFNSLLIRFFALVIGTKYFRMFVNKLVLWDCYEFTKLSIKIQYLSERYDQIHCYSRFEREKIDEYIPYLSEVQKETWKKTVFFYGADISSPQVFRNLRSPIKALLILLKRSFRTNFVRRPEEERYKYLLRIESLDPRSYSLNADNDEGALKYRDPLYLLNCLSVDPKQIRIVLSHEIPETIESLKNRKGLSVLSLSTKDIELSFRNRFELVCSILLLPLLSSSALKYFAVGIAKGMVEYFSFTALVGFGRPVAHFTSLDIDPEQVLRTAALEKKGIHNVYIQDSLSWFVEGAGTQLYMVDFLYSKYFLAGKKSVLQFREKMYYPGGDSVITGILRAQANVQMKEFVRNEKRLYSSRFDKIICIFDESIVCRDLEISLPTAQELYNFYTDVLRLVKEFPDYLFILKPKIPESGSYSSFVESEKRSGLPFYTIFSEFKTQQNVEVFDFRYSSVYPILLSDLVVSPGFATTGFEAVALGVPSIFHNPKRGRNAVGLDSIREIVSEDYDTLKDNVFYWLGKQEEFRTKMLPQVEDYISSTSESIELKF
ncbi:hypothetical protein EHQ13_04250 [Leptospira gomenensis]|uniref:Uncharacterized protein n=1 Tax=Leptospira gomenensis TaxID=2484974 RepID=A0A5F1Y7J3_9LEPT|nr:hypothetical protein [Leptospira gomenensis]TGK30926.1 hypothetical protein EHQ17_14480 [Leptospira gomenensis]TGK45354.1 hypothetical protein EHQ07_10515 [Leptospira gomenensis]TGK66267.1 hypothetical protein EHQ13_04250 [Leptospira gomenensis]